MSAQLTVIRSTPTHTHARAHIQMQIHLQINNNTYVLPFLVELLVAFWQLSQQNNIVFAIGPLPLRFFVANITIRALFSCPPLLNTIYFCSYVNFSLSARRPLLLSLQNCSCKLCTMVVVSGCRWSKTLAFVGFTWFRLH